jgi:hypothetical protein
MNINNTFKLGLTIGILSVCAFSLFILHAQDINPFTSNEAQQFEQAEQKVSIIGTVSQISNKSITLIGAQASDKTKKSSYTISLLNVEKIETRNYEPITLSSIREGDIVVAQGLTNGSSYFATRIISFADSQEEEVIEEESNSEVTEEQPSTQPEPTEEPVTTPEEPSSEPQTIETPASQTQPEPTPEPEVQTEPAKEPEPTPEVIEEASESLEE